MLAENNLDRVIQYIEGSPRRGTPEIPPTITPNLD